MGSFHAGGRSAYHLVVDSNSIPAAPRPCRVISTPHGELRFGSRCLIMGILNVTPDSFSDGGRYLDPAAALDRAGQMVREGVDVIDIGGESTRPGSRGVSDAEQMARVLPAIEAIRRGGIAVPISIDTQSAQVAAAALDAGTDIVNDVSGARHDAGMPALLARSAAPFIIMHMLGTPEAMQAEPRYADVVAEVGEFFLQRDACLAAAGVDVERNMMVDPGIGFGKTLEHNLSLIRASAAAYGERWPVVIGASRKGFIGRILSESADGVTPAPASMEVQFGTAATVAHAALSGIDMVRIHDVAQMRSVVDICQRICSEDGAAGA